MTKYLIALALLVAGTSFAFAEEGKEATDNDATNPYSHGTHLGVELDMMPGGPENGSMLPFFLLQHDKFLFSLGGNFYTFDDQLQGKTRYWQGETRLTYRQTIADWSYLDIGLDFSWQWGTQTGKSMGGNWSSGPMIGLTRQFPHTAFYFTAFVVVAQYIDVNAAGASTASAGTGWGFFENGGVGIRYLF